MPKPHPIELRERVVDHVFEGHTHRATAARFRVSIKFVNDMVKLKQATGSLQAKPSGGRRGGGKLEPFTTFIRERVSRQGILLWISYAAIYMNSLILKSIALRLVGFYTGSVNAVRLRGHIFFRMKRLVSH